MGLRIDSKMKVNTQSDEIRLDAYETLPEMLWHMFK